MNSKKTTLKEIASLSGVSIATVSRYQKSPESIKKCTRQKIENALSILNGNASAKSNLIALIIPDITNQFFPLMFRGIESIASTQNLTIIVCDSHGSAEKEEKIVDNLQKLNIAGIIATPAAQESPILERIAHEHSLPIVFVDRKLHLEDAVTVTADNFGGAYQGTKYLLALGHHDILYLGGPQKLSTEQERYRGFVSALGDSGTGFMPSNAIHADFYSDKAYYLVKQLLEKGQFRYSAIFATNDLMAHGAYRALAEKKLSVPKDVSLMGFDDVSPSQLIQLTTIRQPFEEMGRTAMLMLYSIITGKRAPIQNIILPTSIVIRDSCAKIESK